MCPDGMTQIYTLLVPTHANFEVTHNNKMHPASALAEWPHRYG